MYSKKEEIADRLTKLTEPIDQIYERAREFQLKELKEEILNLCEQCLLVIETKERLKSFCVVAIGGLVGAILSSEEFAITLHRLDFWRMYLEQPVGTSALVIVPILLIIYWRVARKLQKLELEKEIFIDVYLERTEINEKV